MKIQKDKNVFEPFLASWRLGGEQAVSLAF
jgi:hypothetical protein